MLIVTIYFLLSFSVVWGQTVQMPWHAHGMFSFLLDDKWHDSGAQLSADRLFEHSVGQQREFLSIFIVPQEKINFTFSKRKEELLYQQKKDVWAKKRGIEIVKFYPLITDIKTGYQHYLFGMRYRIGERQLEEFSSYHFCQGKVVLIKGLGMATTEFISHTMQQIKQSFKCIE